MQYATKNGNQDVQTKWKLSEVDRFSPGVGIEPVVERIGKTARF